MFERVRFDKALLRQFIPVAGLIVALLIVFAGARLVFRPDPRDDLRRADQLFAAGRYYDARDSYAAIVQAQPDFTSALLRLGIVQTVRGERDDADVTLARVIGAGVVGEEHDLARLYQGRVAIFAGRRSDAQRTWATIGDSSAIAPVRRVLEAENFLVAGDYAGAEAAYRASLQPALPATWQRVVHIRLALLRASSDPAAALAELANLPPDDMNQSGGIDWTAPLVPVVPRADIVAAALRSPRSERAAMLGQVYLDAGLYTLAEAQFASVAPESTGAIGAAAYAAYTQWSAGDRAAGQQRLEEIVADYPGDARARALLALVYLSADDAAQAKRELDVVRAMAPRAPDTHLAWAQWYAAQHDYVAASDEYARAFRDAAADRAGEFALAEARFHLDTSFQLCDIGLTAADRATRLLPNDEPAWTTFAAARFGCNDATGARDAATEALRLDPASAEASYYLGRALAQLGERAEAKTALVNAADLAPGSPWRERAETQIEVLGL